MCNYHHCSFKQQQQKIPPRKKNRSGEGKNKDFTYEQRCKIEGYAQEGKSVRDIACLLGAGKSALSAELRRGRHQGGAYCAGWAQHRRYGKRKYAKKECNKVVSTPNIQKHVEGRLRAGQSPESISSWTHRSSGVLSVSPKSIRKFIQTRPGLEQYLFWNRNDKKDGPKRKESSEKLSDRKFIDERPEEAEYQYGHWEIDFLVSKDGRWVLLVLVERSSKYVLLRALRNRNNDLVNEAVVSELTGYTVRTLTLDNDIAFRKHCELEEKLEAPIYFTHPYASWEKGLVENTNRWIRQFIPKRTNIGNCTSAEIHEIEEWMDHMPRPCLKGRTPYETMTEREYGVRVSSLVVNLPAVRIWG